MKQGGPKETNAPAAPIAKERGVILAESKETHARDFQGYQTSMKACKVVGPSILMAKLWFFTEEAELCRHWCGA